jgi:organic hydroperoxide reductase OsmC/OhrA
MQPFPHHYSVSASGTSGDDDVMLKSTGLPVLPTAPPAEFGGPGDLWSPETLFVAAIADCYVLTFRAVARASKFAWVALSCNVDGTLDRVDRVSQFTACTLRVRLKVSEGTDKEQAHRLLEKAEHGCLVTNSLKFAPTLETEIEVVPASEPVEAWHQVD